MQTLSKTLFRACEKSLHLSNTVWRSTEHLGLLSVQSYSFGKHRAKATAKQDRHDRKDKRKELAKILAKPKPERAPKELVVSSLAIQKENHQELFEDVTSYYLRNGRKVSTSKMLVLFSRLAHLTQADRDVNHPAIVGMVQRMYVVNLRNKPQNLANFMKYTAILNIRDANLWKKFIEDMYLTDFSENLSSLAEIIRYMPKVNIRDPEIWDYLQSEATKHVGYQKPRLGKSVPRDFLHGFIINKVRLTPELERQVLSALRLQAHSYDLAILEEVARLVVWYSFKDEELWTLLTKWSNIRLKEALNTPENLDYSIIASLAFNLSLNLAKADLLSHEPLFEGFYDTLKNFYNSHIKNSDVDAHLKMDIQLALITMSLNRTTELNTWAEEYVVLLKREQTGITAENIKRLSAVLSFSDLLNKLDPQYTDYLINLLVNRRLTLGPVDYVHLVSKFSEVPSTIGTRIETFVQMIAYYLQIYPNQKAMLQSLVVKLNSNGVINIKQVPHLYKLAEL